MLRFFMHDTVYYSWADNSTWNSLLTPFPPHPLKYLYDKLKILRKETQIINEVVALLFNEHLNTLWSQKRWNFSFDCIVILIICFASFLTVSFQPSMIKETQWPSQIFLLFFLPSPALILATKDFPFLVQMLIEIYQCSAGTEG